MADELHLIASIINVSDFSRPRQFSLASGEHKIALLEVYGKLVEFLYHIMDAFDVLTWLSANDRITIYINIISRLEGIIIRSGALYRAIRGTPLLL
jgi:hypothetical protein